MPSSERTIVGGYLPGSTDGHVLVVGTGGILAQESHLALSRGGVGADLSATGPGFLRQATTGAAVTVAALSSSDLPPSPAFSGTVTAPALTGGASPLRLDTHYGQNLDSASGAFDLAASNLFTRTLDGTNGTLSLANGQVGQRFMVVLVQDATGSRTATWWGSIRWPGGSAPALTTAAGKADVFTFVEYSSGSYYGFPAGYSF